ncbi:MAG: acetyl-CoA carboxylase biotin carboxylase subunit [Acidobacteriota bacterium]|nr:acetyl-CoA carboxylase biotin carboxylase subunit [Acidobacteriota bacterium]
MFSKLLIANRGEIAVRLMRGLRELDIRGVAVYSDADRGALHVRMADEAAHIGAAPSADSYLNTDRILDAARKHGVEAIHPGYGFLSENADFAAACEAAGFIFIGPPADAIRKLGSKTRARVLAKKAGAPVVPGSEEPAANLERARAVAHELGYPVLLKAAAGGGGKGMRLVNAESELEAAIRDASSEAERSFRSREVYIEKALVRPRHIEIQVLGDKHGNLIHLGERECSIQRRHQKVIEECPSPLVALHPEMRAAMGEAALRVARSAGYFNAGTAEFLVDAERNFYFLEMNTRLQVEHPVTELVTGLDLVHWQLRIAAGERLPFAQDEIQWRGWAMECRVYAEDPDHGFMPSPGEIVHLSEPRGPGVRLDSGVYPGWTVPIDYDPLLAKLAVWAADRPAAIARMQRALSEYAVTGIRTNLKFFRELLADPEFVAARLYTTFLDDYFPRLPEQHPASAELQLVAAAAALEHSRNLAAASPPAASSVSRWSSEGRSRLRR